MIPSGGHTTAAIVARFVSVAYEGADIVVILDHGHDTAKTQQEIDSRFGSRIATTSSRIRRSKAISPQRRSSAGFAKTESRSIERFKMPSRPRSRGLNYKRRLRDLSDRLLGREYRVTIDGSAIANLTREPELDPEIRGLLSRLLAGDPSITA
jgi:hypothetical protein